MHLFLCDCISTPDTTEYDSSFGVHFGVWCHALFLVGHSWVNSLNFSSLLCSYTALHSHALLWGFAGCLPMPIRISWHAPQFMRTMGFIIIRTQVHTILGCKNTSWIWIVLRKKGRKTQEDIWLFRCVYSLYMVYSCPYEQIRRVKGSPYSSKARQYILLLSSL